MTEPLTRLLHDVGDDVTAPPPPTSAVLERGRHLRRRRTAVLSAGVSVAVVAVLTGALLLPGGGDDRAVDPVAPSGPTFDGVTFAVGDEVYLDGGETVVQIDDRAVKSLYYSSVGVVVRHGNDSASDGGGPQRFTLIRPDGTVSPASVETEETAHGVDPDQPYLAWAEAAGGGVEVVVHDVGTDTEVARVPVEGRFTWSPPPVALEGDTVYVGGRPGEDPAFLAVDWRTGEVTESERTGYFPQLTGERTVEYDREPTVVDVTSGEVLYTADGRDGFLTLSPDGRFVAETGFDERTFENLDATVVDLDTGAGLEMPGSDVGWSEGGQPFVVGGGEVTVCDGTSGDCLTEDVDLGTKRPQVQLGGRTYES
ncbi:hypothetical protein [Nocardioides sp. CFH 31398]|uniref:hypothetical protein n=1 Tax=Nocardioides sp. CFH 31398 TaxID=2919579 RepID=UPI001F06ABBB|nr:hypothetical protein [Nocardioides sp. CFH 31398]MCH1867272.1 hypothetical protein [Nocardioides sp. CFH 31398]